MSDDLSNCSVVKGIKMKLNELSHQLICALEMRIGNKKKGWPRRTTLDWFCLSVSAMFLALSIPCNHLLLPSSSLPFSLLWFSPIFHSEGASTHRFPFLHQEWRRLRDWEKDERFEPEERSDGLRSLDQSRRASCLPQYISHSSFPCICTVWAGNPWGCLLRCGSRNRDRQFRIWQEVWF